MLSRSLLAATLTAGLAACGPQGAPPASPLQQDATNAPPATAPAPPVTPAPAADDPNAPYSPPAPGQPGGLADDKTPISEAPFSPKSAQGAANVVQTYFALIEEKKYDGAWVLWGGGGEASNQTLDDFAKGFAAYAQYHANVGAPGDAEGAAGSSFVDVPVQIYGRMKDGKPFNLLGTVSLRRVNDVDGSTAEQRKWHIIKIDVKQTP